MTQFDTIPLQTAKQRLSQPRPRRKLSTEREAERVRKTKETKARKHAEREAALANQIEDLTATLVKERERSTKLQDNFAALRDLEHEEREQLHIFMEDVREKDSRIAALEQRTEEWVTQTLAARAQRDALQSLVLIHSTRGGALDGALSLLLAALTVAGDDAGHCTWCGEPRNDGDDTDTETHAENCPIGRAMASVYPHTQ